MTPSELLISILNRNVQIWTEGTEICLRAPKDALTPELRVALKEQKTEIINLLGQRRKHAVMSFGQRRLWFLEALEPDTGAYNMSFTAHMHGTLDEAAAQESLQFIIQRHDTLRTHLSAVNGFPVQIIEDSVPFTLETIPVKGNSPEERLLSAKKNAGSYVRRSFILNEGPLIRAALFRMAPDDALLVIAMHHAISDGWSNRVFCREFIQCYESFSQGEQPPLEPLRLQYADLICRQRRELEENIDQRLTFWRTHLAGELPVLELPSDRPRPTVQSFNGAAYHQLLPHGLYAGVKTFAASENCTPYMVVLSAFYAFLNRYTGQDDIIVGSPVAGRTIDGSEELIGFFANTLAMRVQFSGNTSFRTLLDRVRNVTLDTQSHQDLPFDRIVEEIQPGRDLAHSPVFQVAFALQNIKWPSVNLRDVQFDPQPIEMGRTKFDFTLYLAEGLAGLTAIVEYNTDLFDNSTIKRMLDHYLVLLNAAMAAPSSEIGALPVMSQSEQSEVLRLSQGERTSPDLLPVPLMVSACAARNPEALAISSHSGASLSYIELELASNKVAHWLLNTGVTHGDKVAVCMGRGCELPAAVLGIWKAGAAFVPLDPSYPRERLAFMLADSQVTALITLSPDIEHLGGWNGPLLVINKLWWSSSALDLSLSPPEQTTSLDDLAYVIYTSGSTGQPKGVEIEHRGLLNLVQWHLRVFQVCSGDRASMVASTSFDASVWEIWPYLAAGASLHIPNDDIRLSPKALADWLMAQRISIAFSPTPIADQLIRMTWPEPCLLRYLLTGGDKLASFPPSGLPFILVNNYGPTENTVVSTWGSVPCNTESLGRLAPSIGMPLDNTFAYVLDERLALCPIGVPGELCVGGQNLARGYLHRPELTARSFISNPFGPGRIYRTGDLVRLLPCGAYEFLGRVDDQLKIRGFRIEPGEIEATLTCHPSVTECAAVPAEYGNDRRIVACLVSHDPDLSPEALRAHLRERLPEHMVPHAFILMDHLPLTPSGKIDRRALSARAADGPNETKLPQTPPQTPTEIKLADIWRSLINIENIGRHDSFFDLGGHSLLGIQLLARIQETFNTDLPVRVLFESSTLSGLAHRIDVALGYEHDPLENNYRTLPDDLDPTVIPIRANGAKPPFFCAAPATGVVFTYFHMARLLGSDQPVFGLQDPRLHGRKDIWGIEQIAEYHLHGLRQVQPKGPYYLGGWSFGGLVALEMARRLLAQGEEIALLAMMDAPSRGAARPPVNGFTGYIREWIHGIKVFFHDAWDAMPFIRSGFFMFLSDIFDFVRGRKIQGQGAMNRFRWHVVDSLYQKMLHKAEIPRVLSGDDQADLMQLPAFQRIPVTLAANIREYRAYQQNPYPGKLTLIRTEWTPNSPASHYKHDMGWDAFASGGVEVHVVQGNHAALLAMPYVHALSDALRQCLDAARIQSQGSK